MILTYDAVDDRGQKSSSIIEANTISEAVSELRRQGLFVTRIDQSSTRKTKSAYRKRRPITGRLSLRALGLFTRQMEMLLRAGSGLVPAIQAIGRQMTRPRQAVLLDNLADDVGRGISLKDAMIKHPRTFDAVYCAIIAAGEATGSLAEMFERLSDIVVKRRALQTKIMGSFAYPILLILMSTSIVQVLLFFVLPRFAAMFDQLGVKVPYVTQLLLTAAQFIRGFWPLLLVMFLAFVATIIWFLTSKRGKQWATDVILTIPFIGTLRSRLIQGHILRTMGMLIESGVGVLDTLELARASTRSRKFQGLFDKLESEVTAGNPVSSAFEDSDFIEPYISQAVRTGENSGQLGESMIYCADILDESNTELINVVTRLMEPAILIVMGFVVGGVAISLFMPLFDMTSAMH